MRCASKTTASEIAFWLQNAHAPSNVKFCFKIDVTLEKFVRLKTG